jgi:hypothetical protein
VIEIVFAAIVLAACAVLFVRLLIGPVRRARFDDAVRRSTRATRQAVRSGWYSVRHGRRSRREAERVADEIIRRARGQRDGADTDGEWEGNVYKPKSFRKPRKLH